MTLYEDLATLDYFSFQGAHLLRAIGWLGPQGSYRRGSVSDGDVGRLCDLFRDPWRPDSVFLGWHECELCTEFSSPRLFECAAGVIELGTTNLFVPSTTCVFVAPSLMLHYIRDHAYEPPDTFLHAVRECPPQQSAAFRNRLADVGGPLFGKRRPPR